MRKLLRTSSIAPTTNRKNTMQKPLRPLNLILAILAYICFSSPALSDSYEEMLDENHHTLSQWSIPIVSLSIESASPDPNDENLLSLKIRVLDVYRKGPINIKKGIYNAQWRTYKEIAEAYTAFSSKAKAEPTGKELLNSLTKEKLICFTGQSIPEITLYAYDCFPYNNHNDTTAREKSINKAFSIYLYEYSQIATLTLPLIALIVVFFLPKTGIATAFLAFPSFIYYNSLISDTTIRYDYLFAYPAMALSSFVIIFGIIRLLHQMVKKEQEEKEEKARTREHAKPKSNCPPFTP